MNPHIIKSITNYLVKTIVQKNVRMWFNAIKNTYYLQESIQK